jgi:hypothetical protein
MSRTCLSRIMAAALAALAAACQTAVPEPAAVLPQVEPAVGPLRPEPAASQPSMSINWAAAPDCLGKLRLLDDVLKEGRIGADEQVPIVVALPDRSDRPDWLEAPSVTTDLPPDLYQRSAAATPDAPCLLSVERPQDLQVQHRILARDQVRSLYQSGVRTERNPDYDLAQAHVRDAERRAKEDGPDVLHVGDPLLDLVGTLIGGVVSGFSRAGREDELNTAMAELAATPRSRDRPVYQPYHFEQIAISASKEATIPIALHDRSKAVVWRARLHQSEMRRFKVLEGLDARDRDYQQHRDGSLTRDEFERWCREPPQLHLSSMVTALGDAGSAPQALVATAAGLNGGSPSPPTRSRSAVLETPAPPEPSAGEKKFATGAGPIEPDDRSAVTIGDDGRNDSAAAVQAPFWHLGGAQRDKGERIVGSAPSAKASLIPDLEFPAPAAGTDREVANPRARGLVQIAADNRTGGGFYVRPDLVLTTAKLVADTSVIDVASADGLRVLGLVARVDPARDLALVQVPRSGSPVDLYDGPPVEIGRLVDVVSASNGGFVVTRGLYRGLRSESGGATAALAEVETASPSRAQPGGAWFLADRVIAMTGSSEADQGLLLAVPVSEIAAFLYGADGALAALP